MAPKRDYYQVLGVDRASDAKQVKSAYRKLAVKYHPDRNPGDAKAADKFKEAAEAYAVLSDPEKRARYDRFGHQGVSGTGFSGFDATTFGDFADILGDFFGLGFGDLFGSRRGRRVGEPGADLRYQLTLTLEEAAFGTEQVLRIPRLETCSDCQGSGSSGDSAPDTCAACGGYGQIRISQGFFTVARTCPQCRGEGRLITNPCATCHGEGRVERERSIEVKIPAGVDTGTRLRLSGEGEHGRRGGPTGDLYVDIRIRSHGEFQREGPHVRGILEITFAQAVLGTSLEVSTLHGLVALDIPAGTPHGQEFRLVGKGIPRLDGRGNGDHLVQVSIRVPHPRDLTQDQMELLRLLAEAEGKEVREDRGVLHRVRDLFG